ncbi:TPA: helix-turn-helix domain-containing protein [Streptococcus suis]|nr:helix-turn-helix domain-containing protein [Streptococcus suis]
MNKLKTLRKENNLTQEELAKKIGVNLRTLQKWENGESSIRTKNAEKLAKYFSVNVGDLLDLDVTIEPKFLNLNKTRKYFNLSLETLSVLLGLPKNSLDAWENERNFIPFKEASKLYNYLNIKREDFIKIVAQNNLEFEFSISDFFDEIDIEKINKLSHKKNEDIKASQTLLKSYINDPIKFQKLKEGLSDIDEGYFLILQRFIIADKEVGANFSDMLIDYITLTKTDREIVSDLVYKLANRNKDN